MSASNSLLDLKARHWRPPLLTKRKPTPAVDQAGQTLERLARELLVRAPAVLGNVAGASQAPVERSGYVDIPEIPDRAWRFTHVHCEIFCVLDERSERELLHLILGGAPARRLSAIERSIVAESIGRLLSSQAEPPSDLREEPRIRPPAQAWRCNVELRGAKDQTASIQLFTACLPSPPPTDCVAPSLSKVPLQLRASFPAITCAIGEVSNWRAGTLLRLRCPDRNVCTLLFAGGRRVAIAHLGAFLGDRAVKLVELCASGP